MNLLKKAENTLAFFKAGIFGFQGSGKTYTASLLAIGICEAIKNKTVAFMDTETGSDFLLPKLRKAGIEVFSLKSRAFKDLLDVVDEAVKEEIGVLIVDSISHIWRDLLESYDKKLKRNGRLQFQDWGIIKPKWHEYTDKFINSPLHIIVCGRAGYDYDYDYNEDGSKDLIKTGTKMKAETEFGFEPHLIIEMERIPKSKEEINNIKNRKAKQGYQPKIGSGWIHRAYVLKDRTDNLNGQSFDYPTFKNFEPHFQALNVGGEHLGVDTSRNSEDQFDIEGRPDWKQRKIKKDIALEKIQNTGSKLWPSTGKEDKALKLKYVETLFGTNSWTEVTEQSGQLLEWIADLLPIFEDIYGETKDIEKSWLEVRKQADAAEQKKEPEPDDIPL